MHQLSMRAGYLKKQNDKLGINCDSLIKYPWFSSSQIKEKLLNGLKYVCTLEIGNAQRYFMLTNQFSESFMLTNITSTKIKSWEPQFS